MRFRALCLALLTMIAPASAAESIADQAQHAYGLFAGGLSQQDFLSAQYGNKLFAGIGGNWVRLNGPDPKTGVETYGADTDNFCKSHAAVTLSSSNSMSMTLSTNLPKDNFTQSLHPDCRIDLWRAHRGPALPRRLGLGPDNRRSRRPAAGAGRSAWQTA